VNDFRRKIKNEHLAKRAKNLLKKWRDAVKLEDPPVPSQKPQNGNAVSNSQISEGPSQGPGVDPHGLPISLHARLGISSTSSSPKFPYSSNVSPCWSQNSNSLSPGLASKLNLNNNNNSKVNSSIQDTVINCNSVSNSNDASSCSTANTADSSNCTNVNFESALGSVVSSVTESMPSSPNIAGADDSSHPSPVSATPAPTKKRRKKKDPGYIDGKQVPKYF